ncbi:MAG TPA: diphthine--ammonia ligase [Thermoplasmata archaeon]|nr:diphthine--ammonia ligase [Thermoplasmata archaeon]
MFKVDFLRELATSGTGLHGHRESPLPRRTVSANVRAAVLFSGGKDSTYAAYVAMQRGWEVGPLLTIRPTDPESMMFHVPNLSVTSLQAEAMGIPLVEEAAPRGEAGELEALLRILRRAEADGVVVGAIASDYQHSRVNRIAAEVGLRVFAPLWRQDPRQLVRDYLRAGFRIVFSSVSAEGLDASWLGRPWDSQTVEELLRLQETRGVHPCGEGGEFETLVLDAPCFRRRIVVDVAERTWDGSAGVWRVTAAHLEDKSSQGDHAVSGGVDGVGREPS